MRLGITGHQRLRDPAAWEWVTEEFDRVVPLYPPPLIGVTSLAIGADQLFAEVILRHRGTLEVIVPYAGYEETFRDAPTRDAYRRYMAQAARTEVLPVKASAEDAYLEAGKTLVRRVDVLLAVWDGRPAAGRGGTADIVHYARDLGKRIIHFNPDTRVATLIEGPFISGEGGMA